MNYSDVVTTALGFSDRANDPEAVALIDSMLRMVEAEVNRELLVMPSSVRASVVITDATQEYYDLPVGFSSFRSIKIVTSLDNTAKRITLSYIAPTKMDEVKTSQTMGSWYTIEANKIWIYSSALVVGNYIQYVNYADIAPLTSSSTTNWLSDSYPDCYVMGLTKYICAFAKDWASHAQYKQLFDAAILAIDLQDDKATWSGSPLATQIG